MHEPDSQKPEEIRTISSFSHHVGIRTIKASPELVISEMPVTEVHANRNNMLHGGAIMTLADNAAGTAAFINVPEGQTNTTIESKTNFLRGVKVGDTLTARCVTVHRGRTVLVFQITMNRSDGKTAAVSTQTHMILTWRDDAKGEGNDG